MSLKPAVLAGDYRPASLGHLRNQTGPLQKMHWPMSAKQLNKNPIGYGNSRAAGDLSLLNQMARCQIAPSMGKAAFGQFNVTRGPTVLVDPAIMLHRYQTGPVWKSGGLVQGTIKCDSTTEQQPSECTPDVEKPTPKQNDHASTNKPRRHDPFAHAQPITAGVGLDLIRRMGWCEGQGLGRQGEGRTEPVSVALRKGRAGLASHDERPRMTLTQPQPLQPPPPKLAPPPPPPPPPAPVEGRPRPSKQKRWQQQRQKKKAQQKPEGQRKQTGGGQEQMPNAMTRLGRLSKTYSGMWPTYRLVHEIRRPCGNLYLYSVTAMLCNYCPIKYQPNHRLAKLAAAEQALRYLDPDAKPVRALRS